MRRTEGSQGSGQAASTPFTAASTSWATQRGTGIAIHRTRSLRRRDTRTREALPLTAPPRTILDLASELNATSLERVVAETYALRLANERDLRQQVALNARRPRVAALRRLLDRDAPPARTMSPAEELLLRAIRQSGLPEPEVNAVVEGHLVDFVWLRFTWADLRGRMDAVVAEVRAALRASGSGGRTGRA